MAIQWGRVARHASTWLGLALALMALYLTFRLARTPEPVQVQAQDEQTWQDLPPLIRSVKGPDLFHAYCASCHGPDGRGRGPAAPAFRSMPDLTTLARRAGGQFPDARVRKVIMGDEIITAHGSREMPVWGPIFHQIEEDVDRGNVRLENLVKYLESIQSPR